jgi:hypothetical protein
MRGLGRRLKVTLQACIPETGVKGGGAECGTYADTGAPTPSAPEEMLRARLRRSILSTYMVEQDACLSYILDIKDNSFLEPLVQVKSNYFFKTTQNHKLYNAVSAIC